MHEQRLYGEHGWLRLLQWGNLGLSVGLGTISPKHCAWSLRPRYPRTIAHLVGCAQIVAVQILAQSVSSVVAHSHTVRLEGMAMQLSELSRSCLPPTDQVPTLARTIRPANRPPNTRLLRSQWVRA